MSEHGDDRDAAGERELVIPGPAELADIDAIEEPGIGPYWLFTYDTYYPAGGGRDYRSSHPTLRAAMLSGYGQNADVMARYGADLHAIAHRDEDEGWTVTSPSAADAQRDTVHALVAAVARYGAALDQRRGLPGVKVDEWNEASGQLEAAALALARATPGSAPDADAGRG